uniref:Protein kinase domain-containing protein n=1 Tax=Oryza barthii TaxID=65489 RepID=A0A0D3HDK0_9ORYZ
MEGSTSKHDSLVQKHVDFGILENNIQDPTATPMYLPMEFLKTITCDFSKEQELGRGGYGVVYKGVFGSKASRGLAWPGKDSRLELEKNPSPWGRASP